MERELIHELVAAYALDALDDSERRDFEEHLATCEQCRDELEGLRDAAAALAYIPEGPAPPPALRDRVLKRVYEDRAPNVVPLRRRYTLPAVATFAVAATAATIVLAVWGSNLSSSLDRKDTIAQVLASGQPMRLAPGMRVTVARGKAVVVSGLGHAAPGTIFELWVIQNGTPSPAGTFGDAPPSSPVLLSGTVPAGARIGVSVEKHRVGRPTHIIGETEPL